MKLVHCAIPVLVLALLTAPLAYVGSRLLDAMMRLPDGSVEEHGGQRPQGDKVVALLGDSLTHGHIGFNWVARLREQLEEQGYRFINAGINGDVSWSLEQRLQPILDLSPDIAVVLIGTNDAMGAFNDEDNQRYKDFLHVPFDLTKETYRKSLSSILTQLQQAPSIKHRAVLTLPPLGENTTSEANKLIGAFNNELVTIATHAETTVLPLNERLWNSILDVRNRPEGCQYQAATPKKLMITLSLIKQLGLGWSLSDIANSVGCQMFVDTIHFNQKGGEILGDLVHDFIQSPSPA